MNRTLLRYIMSIALAAAFLTGSDLQAFAFTSIRSNDSAEQDIASFLPPIRGIPFDELPHWLPGGPPIDPGEENEELLVLIAQSLTWLGTPYHTGGFSRNGIDCSGFMHTILTEVLPGKGPFPRQSAEFVKIGKKADNIRPGDILLFAINGEIIHVGLALSPFTFIHAASKGAKTGVIISSLFEGNWRSRLFAIRRIWN